MKNAATFLILSLLLAGCVNNARQEWRLVWEEDFDVPMIISRMADRARVPLLGRKACVRRVNISLETPANSVNRPMSQAVVKRVAAGLEMQRTPRTTSRIPAMASQILVLVFMFKGLNG